MRAGILLPLCNTQSSTPSRAPRAGPPAAPEGTRESSPGKHSFGNMIMVFSFLLRMPGTATTEPSGNWMWPSRARLPDVPRCPGAWGGGVGWREVPGHSEVLSSASLASCFAPPAPPPQVPVQPAGAAEGVGAEHGPGQLQAQAAHGHLLRALPARVLQRLREPQEPEAQCCAHAVCLSGRHAGECTCPLSSDPATGTHRAGGGGRGWPSPGQERWSPAPQ